MRYCWDNNICRTPFMKWYISDQYWTDNITTETYESGLKETLDGIERLYFSASYYDMVKVTKLCNFLLPRLIRFKQVTIGYPPDMTPEKWDGYIESTIEEVKQGILYKFCERFNNFWW